MSKKFIEFSGHERETPTIFPPAGHRDLYAKADGWYDMDSTGEERRLSNDVPGDTSALQYRARLTGANGSLTSTTVSYTDFPVTLTGAYVSEGVYTLTAASGTPFTADLTIPLISVGTATGGINAKAEVTSTSVITIRTFAADGTTAADAIGTLFISITVDVLVVS